MNAASSSSALDEYRVQARLLLKDLRSEDPSRRDSAARRFARLRTRADAADPTAARESIRLKHALTVVALEAGYCGWSELKSALADAKLDESMLMYDRGFDVLLNRWFAHYEQAAESLRAGGGYLLPYRNQFVVCEAEAIRLLGLDPEDPDWDRMGRDWARPRDRAAWNRLRARRIIALTRGERP